MPHINTTNMIRLLGTLPQELYDEIYNFTFTADNDALVITKSWRPPAMLQVDRASRARFSASYFGSPPVICLDFGDDHFGSLLQIAFLLVALDSQHAGHIRRIRYVLSQASRETLSGRLRNVPAHQMERPIRNLLRRRLGIWSEVKGPGVQQAVFDLAARLEIVDERM